MHQRYSKAQYLLMAILGRLIAGPPLNHVTRSFSAGHVYYLKRRYWYAAPLIAGARHTRARFRMLPKAEWHVWECAVYRQLYGEVISSAADGALIVTARPGRTVADLLSNQEDRQAGLAGVAAALRALAQLHQQVIDLPDRQSRPFSHADATVANVTYAPASDSAWWFDFETAHDPHSAHCWCCADDLRALLFSALAVAGASYVSSLARLVAIEYARPDVLDELRSMAALLLHQPDPWHLAQAQLSYELHQAMVYALLHEFEQQPGLVE